MALHKEWTWGRRGADLHDDHLVWYEALGPVAYASGAGCEQTFDDFLAHGPRDESVPAEVLAEIAMAVFDRSRADAAAMTRLAEVLDARGTPATTDTASTACSESRPRRTTPARWVCWGSGP